MADAVTQLQHQCVRELTSLRDELDESEEEKTLLRRKLESLTVHLAVTTEELAQRAALFTDASAQADRLETQVADAKRALLTREMKIYELTQQCQSLEATLQTERQARDHWEREFTSAKDNVARMERQLSQQKEKRHDRSVEAGGWKAKLQLAMASIHELQGELETAREREVQLRADVAEAKADRNECERQWKAKVGKRDRTIGTLQQQLATLREAQAQGHTRAKEWSEKEAQWRSSEATQQLERRRQLLALQDQVQRMNEALDKAQMHDILAQRELCRLREELLLSESQRTTEQRRYEQQRKGKEKEMAFVWQTYVEAVASRRATAGTPTLNRRHPHAMR